MAFITEKACFLQNGRREGKVGERTEKNARLIKITFIYSHSSAATLKAHRQESPNARNGLVVNDRNMAAIGLNNQVTCPHGPSKEETDEE